MEHISWCKMALTQEKYRRCHDKWLSLLGHILEQERRKKHQVKTKPLPSTIAFVKEGQTPVVMCGAKLNLLQFTQGWEMKADLRRKLQFQEESLSTTLRPAIVLWSQEGKKVILVELTVHWEEGCEETAERKKTKTQVLSVPFCQNRHLSNWSLHNK